MSLVAEVVVEAVARDKSLRMKDIRNAGFIPAVIYSKGKEAVEIQIEYQAFRKAFRETGTSTVLDVKFDGNVYMTLVHDIQWHPVSGNYIHVDLYEVKEDERVSTTVEVILEGLAPAVKLKAAVLKMPTRIIEVECFPRNLFHDVRVDISGLTDYHQEIKISDLAIANDEKIKILTDVNEVVVGVNPPKGGIVAMEEEEASA